MNFKRKHSTFLDHSNVEFNFVESLPPNIFYVHYHSYVKSHFSLSTFVLYKILYHIKIQKQNEDFHQSYL